MCSLDFGEIACNEFPVLYYYVDVWRSNHSRVCMVKQACRGVRSNHSRVCMVKQACRGVRSNHSRVCMVKQACRGVAE